MDNKKGGIIGVAILVGIGAYIGSRYVVKPRPVDPPKVVAPAPEATIDEKPIDVKPADPPKPRDLKNVPTDILLEQFEAWQKTDDPRTPYIQAVYEELLQRKEIRWEGTRRSGDDYAGRRRWRR